MEKYPLGHADAITPERLVACGGRMACGRIEWQRRGHEPPRSPLIYVIGDRGAEWFLCSIVPSEMAPRNMGEVWELLDRLGIDWRTKGGE